MVKHDCSSAVYVGDTNGDCQAAFSAGIPLVYAAYGFGKISEPSLVAAEADDFEKYRKILRYALITTFWTFFKMIMSE